MDIDIPDFDTALKNAFFTLPNVYSDIVTVVKTNPDIMTPYLFVTTLTLIQFLGRIQSPTVNNSIAILAGIVLLWGNGYVYIVTHNTLADTSITNPERTSLYRMPTFFGTLVATTIIVIGGLLLFLLPGMYLSLKLALAAPASVVNTDNSILSALQESYKETSGHLILILTVFGTISFIFTPLLMITAEFGLTVAVLGLTLLATLVFTPTVQLVVGILYTRLRQENNTIQ